MKNIIIEQVKQAIREMKTVIAVLIAATLLAGYMVADKASMLVSRIQSEKIVALNQIR